MANRKKYRIPKPRELRPWILLERLAHLFDQCQMLIENNPPRSRRRLQAIYLRDTLESARLEITQYSKQYRTMKPIYDQLLAAGVEIADDGYPYESSADKFIELVEFLESKRAAKALLSCERGEASARENKRQR